jgi:hypothetical protein
VDLLATIADVAGQKRDSDTGPDSVSLLPVLEGDGNRVRAILADDPPHTT